MKLVYLGYDHPEIDRYKIGDDLIQNDVQYVTPKDIMVIGVKKMADMINAAEPAMVIEREFNDGIAAYHNLLKQIQALKVWWAIDTHVRPDHFEYAKLFDVVMSAGARYVNEFRKVIGNDRAFYLPLCYPGSVSKIVINRTPPKYEISFVGNITSLHKKRGYMVQALKEHYGDRFQVRIRDYNEMERVFRQSRIVFNCSLDGDLNFRIWEALAQGAEIITDNIAEIDAVKGLRERINTYDDQYELFYKIDHLLANDPEFTNNTIKNQEWVKLHHTYINRLTCLIAMAQDRVQIEV